MMMMKKEEVKNSREREIEKDGEEGNRTRTRGTSVFSLRDQSAPVKGHSSHSCETLVYTQSSSGSQVPQQHPALGTSIGERLPEFAGRAGA